jgi:hypothetical protein
METSDWSDLHIQRLIAHKLWPVANVIQKQLFSYHFLFSPSSLFSFSGMC